MIFVPLPFVVSLLLLLLLMRMVSEAGLARTMWPFMLLIAGYAALAALIGLRWGYGVIRLMPVMAVLATALPPLAFHAYSTLLYSQPAWLRAALGLPPLLVIVFFAVRPFDVDWFLAANGIVFGFALLMLASKGPDTLTRVSLEKSRMAHRSLVAFALLLILLGLVDVAIALDFTLAGGAHAANYVSAANLVGILVLALAASGAGTARPDADDEDEQPELPSEEHRVLAAKLDVLIAASKLHLDPDLTLNRLARRTLIPARRISEAVNRTRGESVSTYINRFRIGEACRLLRETEKSVTAIMFDSGFQTKSNFNREFLRQTGSSPAAWRTMQPSPAS